jgi:hypothetical protein
MKKALASFLLLFATTVSVFAQDNLKKGDLIYGTVTENGKPLSGVRVVERNANDRIMAQDTTDANGQYSFRLVNPQNRLMATRMDYETVDIAITKKNIDINIKKQPPLPPVQMLDGPVPPEFLEMMKEQARKDSLEKSIMTKDKRQDIYLPYRDNIHYGSIQELFDNLYLDM